MTEQTKIADFDRESIFSESTSELWKELVQKASGYEHKKMFAIIVPLPTNEIPEEEIIQIKEPRNRFADKNLQNDQPKSPIIALENKKDFSELRRYFNLWEVKSATIYVE